jgi:hypothetical protein
VGLMLGYLIILLSAIVFHITSITELNISARDKIILILSGLMVSVTVPIITCILFLNKFESHAFLAGLSAVFVAVLMIPANIIISIILNRLFKKSPINKYSIILSVILLIVSIGAQVLFSAIGESSSSLVFF